MGKKNKTIVIDDYNITGDKRIVLAVGRLPGKHRHVKYTHVIKDLYIPISIKFYGQDEHCSYVNIDTFGGNVLTDSRKRAYFTSVFYKDTNMLQVDLYTKSTNLKDYHGYVVIDYKKKASD